MDRAEWVQLEKDFQEQEEARAFFTANPHLTEQERGRNMAKNEVLVREDESTRTVRRPIFTGAKENRKQVGEFETTVLKPGLTAAQVAAWVGKQDPIKVISAYNYGRDLEDRGAASPARPGVPTSMVKTKAGEIDLLKMPDLPGKPGSGKAKAIAMCEAALAYAKLNGVAVPQAYAYSLGILTKK